METDNDDRPKSSARQRADAIKAFRCKNLVAVIEDPSDIKNIGTVIRNANALGMLVEPEHIASVIHFLCSNPAALRLKPLRAGWRWNGA